MARGWARRELSAYANTHFERLEQAAKVLGVLGAKLDEEAHERGHGLRCHRHITTVSAARLDKDIQSAVQDVKTTELCGEEVDCVAGNGADGVVELCVGEAFAQGGTQTEISLTPNSSGTFGFRGLQR